MYYIMCIRRYATKWVYHQKKNWSLNKLNLNDWYLLDRGLGPQLPVRHDGRHRGAVRHRRAVRGATARGRVPGRVRGRLHAAGRPPAAALRLPPARRGQHVRRHAQGLYLHTYTHALTCTCTCTCTRMCTRTNIRTRTRTCTRSRTRSRTRSHTRTQSHTDVPTNVRT